MTSIPAEYRGWSRIVDTGTWVNDCLDILGPALLSLTGRGDRLRMHCLLAYVNAKATGTGVSFTWEGAWEFNPVSGTIPEGSFARAVPWYTWSQAAKRVLHALGGVVDGLEEPRVVHLRRGRGYDYTYTVAHARLSEHHRLHSQRTD